jgi:hypothetical protein
MAAEASQENVLHDTGCPGDLGYTKGRTLNTGHDGICLSSQHLEVKAGGS